MEGKSRKVHLDILKICACFAVILQHNTDLSVEAPSVWGMHFFFYYIGRFAVPIFVMATGVLLLDKDKTISIRSIFTKYIPRIIFPLIGITYIMQITEMFLAKQYTWKILYRPFVHVLANNVSVPYWYVYMLIGLYLILPFVRRMVHGMSKREMEYFLALFLFVRVGVPLVEQFTQIGMLNKVVNSFMLNLFSGYMALMVLGYYLEKYAKQYNIIILLIADFLVLILPLLYVFGIAEDQRNIGLFFADIFSVNILFHSILLFLIAKKLCVNLKQEHCKIIIRISSMTFGVYILHVFILQAFNYIGINQYNFGKLRIPICAMLNFVICIGSIVLKRFATKCFRRKKYEKK